MGKHDGVLTGARFFRLAATALACLPLLVGTLDAEAGRPIRVDQGNIGLLDGTTGEGWERYYPVTFADMLTTPRRWVYEWVPFRMELGYGLRDYVVEFRPSGLFFKRDPGDTRSDLVIYSPYFQGVGDITWTNGDFASGLLDRTAPYIEADAVEAMRFTWQGVTHTGQEIAAQVVLVGLTDHLTLDDGDFDIELNFAHPTDDSIGGFLPGLLQVVDFRSNDDILPYGRYPDPFTYLCIRSMQVTCEERASLASPVSAPPTLALASVALVAALRLRRRFDR